MMRWRFRIALGSTAETVCVYLFRWLRRCGQGQFWLVHECGSNFCALAHCSRGRCRKPGFAHRRVSSRYRSRITLRLTGQAAWIAGLCLFYSHAVASSHLQDAACTRQSRETSLILSPEERAFVIGQIANGKRLVRAVLVTQPGRSEEVAAKLTALDSQIVMREAEIDFLYVVMPIASIASVMGWSELTGFQLWTSGSNASTLRNLDASAAEPVRLAASAPSGRPPTARTPRDNPYTAGRATQALPFKTKHPTYDGRGVVIGSVEPVNPLAPVLQNAWSLQGERQPKLTKLTLVPPLNVTRTAIPEALPRPFAGQSAWQNTIEVGAIDDSVVFHGRSYALPVKALSGELRMTLFRGPQTEAELLNGILPSVPDFVVLWTLEAGRLWIAEVSATEFSKAISIPVPAEDHVAMAVPFGGEQTHTLFIAAQRATRSLGALIFPQATGGHGTMVASVAVGHDFLGGEMEGVAPGAQWQVAIPPEATAEEGGVFTPTPATDLRAWLSLFRDPGVDVLSNSAAFGFEGASRRLAQASHVDWQVLDRLLAKYPKTFLSAGGNLGPASLGIDHLPAVSDAVITVGAYTPRDTWQANFGLVPSRVHTPASYSQFGPAADGGFKPDLLALSGVFTAMEGNSYYYEAPHGYGISGGTSAATPHAAGHVALLVSAAKQAGIPYDPARLRVALFSTARFLDGVEARVQGHGLIQVEQAWEALQALRDFTPQAFATCAPVRTFWSAQLDIPHRGRGLYEVGWSPGERKTRELRITRTSGSTLPLAYAIRWRQAPVNGEQSSASSAQAFSSPVARVTLPLNQAVSLPVQIHVGPSGAYSAILDLVDPSTGWVVHSVMHTVIVAEPLTEHNGYTAKVTRSAPRPGQGLVFVNVPEGSTALRVRLQQRGGRNAILKVQMPNGQSPGWSVIEGRDYYDHTFASPMAGVWQLWVTHYDDMLPIHVDRKEDVNASATPFRMQVTAVRAAPLARSNGHEVAFVNRYAPVHGAKWVSPLPLGVLRSQHALLKPGLSPVSYDIDVAPGTEKLEVEIQAKAAANVSLLVFALSEGKRQAGLVMQDLSPGGHKRLALMAPAAGTYRVVLDGWGNIPAAGVAVDYHEAQYHPRYGRLRMKSKQNDLKPGDVKATAFEIDHGQSPAAENRLVAQVQLLAQDYRAMNEERLPGQPNWWLWTKAGQKPLRIESEPVVIASQTIDLTPSITRALPE